jgi:hypothetical protein
MSTKVLPLITLFLLAGRPLQAQTDASINRLERQVDALSNDVREQDKLLRNLTERTDQIAKDLAASRCSVRLDLDGSATRTVPGRTDSTIQMEFFGVVSKADACYPAEVRLSATYVDAKGSPVCSGVIEGLLFQSAVTQSIVIELRPWDFQNYARWKNEPVRSNTGAFRQIRCLNDVPADAQGSELARITLLRLRVLLVPPGGQFAMQEIRIAPEASEPNSPSTTAPGVPPITFPSIDTFSR